MKKLIILLLIPIFSFSQSSFSDGYKSGYKKGYCLEDVGCISPIPPIAPIPAPGYNTYRQRKNILAQIFSKMGGK